MGEGDMGEGDMGEGLDENFDGELDEDVGAEIAGDIAGDLGAGGSSMIRALSTGSHSSTSSAALPKR